MIVPKTQWNLEPGHTFGPVGHNVDFRFSGDEVAQEGITRGSDERDQRSDRQAQQGAATDAHAICDHVPEFHRAAR
jgi:hypothetical protein